MELAGLQDITIERNADFDIVVSLEDTEGTAVTVNEARAQMRATKDSQTVLLDLQSAGNAPAITLTEDNTVVNIHIPASVTAAIKWVKGYWDLRVVYSDGEADRLLEGKVTVSREVTR